MAVELLDFFWENGVLGLIGETIDEANYIPCFKVVDRSTPQGVSPTLFSVELTLLSMDTEIVNRVKARWADALSDGVSRKVCHPRVQQMKLIPA